ncbi:polyprenol monophosphomannose synthase [Trueperella sp. LYQ141]|uniref:polyprenol monophosphomannose synthase n=1 Tax=Trueperella sp. LYQ141 TaxID=3391058 RepID=UPI0039836EFF
MTRILICIPTYNERESLPDILQRTRRAVPQCDILIIDDASPDGTGQYAQQCADADAAVFVLHREQKTGLADAYFAGFRWAIARGYDFACQMDADGSHQPEQLPALLQRAVAPDSPELVIGSRWVAGGEVVNWPKYRQVLSRAGNRYVRALTGLPVSDVTAGFRVYRTDLLRRIDFNDVSVHGYFFQVDMTYRAEQLAARIVEVPISFTNRTLGVSKMSSRIIGEAFVHATSLGVRRRWSQLRRRITSR